MYKNAENLNRSTLKDQGMAEFLPVSLWNVLWGRPQLSSPSRKNSDVEDRWRPVLSFNDGKICEMTQSCRKQGLPVKITLTLCSFSLSHLPLPFCIAP